MSEEIKEEINAIKNTLAHMEAHREEEMKSVRATLSGLEAAMLRVIALAEDIDEDEDVSTDEAEGLSEDETEDDGAEGGCGCCKEDKCEPNEEMPKGDASPKPFGFVFYDTKDEDTKDEEESPQDLLQSIIQENSKDRALIRALAGEFMVSSRRQTALYNECLNNFLITNITSAGNVYQHAVAKGTVTPELPKIEEEEEEEKAET